MPDLELQPLFTQAGLTAAIAANGDGLSAQITHLAFGDGGASGYTPQGNETKLRRERERVPITFSLSDGPGSFVVRGKGDESDLEYWVREVGVILSDGTLLAVWSDPDRAITGRGPGAELEFDIKLVLDALPGGSIEIITTPGGSNALLALTAMLSTQAVLTNQQIKQRILIENGAPA